MALRQLPSSRPEQGVAWRTVPRALRPGSAHPSGSRGAARGPGTGAGFAKPVSRAVGTTESVRGASSAPRRHASQVLPVSAAGRGGTAVAWVTSEEGAGSPQAAAAVSVTGLCSRHRPG